MQDFDRDIEDVIEKFAQLVRQIIRKHVYQGDGIDLEDIEQEVRLKIWRFLKKGNKVDNLPSFIKKVAYSTTIDELRRMRNQKPSCKPEALKRVFLETGGISVESAEFSPETRLDGDESRRSIGALVETLSEDRKKVINLFLSGMSLEEISELLNWDRTRIRHLYYRGVDDLKDRCRTPPAGAAGERPDRGEP
jgi:RNA polymerase sigma factor (sigma-70 family)